MPRQRLPSHPIIDSRDDFTMPESDREWCARLLKEHEERYHPPKSSIPVELRGKGFALKGSWKPVVSIVAIVAMVAITYLVTKNLHQPQILEVRPR